MALFTTRDHQKWRRVSRVALGPLVVRAGESSVLLEASLVCSAGRGFYLPVAASGAFLPPSERTLGVAEGTQFTAHFLALGQTGPDPLATKVIVGIKCNRGTDVTELRGGVRENSAEQNRGKFYRPELCVSTAASGPGLLRPVVVTDVSVVDGDTVERDFSYVPLDAASARRGRLDPATGARQGVVAFIAIPLRAKGGPTEAAVVHRAEVRRLEARAELLESRIEHAASILRPAAAAAAAAPFYRSLAAPRLPAPAQKPKPQSLSAGVVVPGQQRETRSTTPLDDTPCDAVQVIAVLRTLLVRAGDMVPCGEEGGAAGALGI